MTDANFRKALKTEVTRAQRGGLTDDEISLALAGAMVAVKAAGYVSKGVVENDPI